MFKFYKRTAEGLCYHEAWENGGVVVEHWGKCGERGETKEHQGTDTVPVSRLYGMIASQALRAGFKPIPEKRMKTLIIEYLVPPTMSDAIQRRHQMEDQFNQLIGWLGLGHLDGGSIGSGTMEISLMVVDFEIAKSALEAAVTGSELAGFNRIYKI